MSIEVKQVTKLYGEQKALDNISFTINTGEVVAQGTKTDRLST